MYCHVGTHFTPDHGGVVLLVCTVLCAGCYHIYNHVGTHCIPDFISAAPGCMTAWEDGDCLL